MFVPGALGVNASRAGSTECFPAMPIRCWAGRPKGGLHRLSPRLSVGVASEAAGAVRFKVNRSAARGTERNDDICVPALNRIATEAPNCPYFP